MVNIWDLEPTVFAEVINSGGEVVGRAVIEDGSRMGCIYSGVTDYCDMAGIGARVVDAGYDVLESFYETGDDRIAEALERYIADAWDALDVWERYVRVFHPSVAAEVVTLRTGYSQGDWVEVAVWSDGSVPCARIDDYVKVAEALGRGQFATVMLDIDDDALPADLAWPGLNSVVGVLYLSEFEPWDVAMECADDMLFHGMSLRAIEPVSVDDYDDARAEFV